MEKQPQTFENHSRFPGSIVANSAFLLISAILAGTGVALALNEASVVLCLVLIGTATIVCAITGIFVALMSRTYALTLQDRIIRLEMGLRFARLLPAPLQERAQALTLGQLIALRFASDSEMVELVTRVLDQQIQDRSAIKKMIRDWQADHQRV